MTTVEPSGRPESVAGQPGDASPAWAPLVLLGCLKFLLHHALGDKYGYFRDELYFLDCARHLDWGYVDHAPMIGLWAKIPLLLGATLPSLRVLPAAAGAALVVLAGLLAWRLGGGRYAQAFAALAVLAAPIYLGTDSLMTMNAFEPLFWMGAVYFLIRFIDTRRGRFWIAAGAMLGLGLMNKHSTAFFAVALAIALVLSRERRALRTPWPWLGAGTALLIFAPNIVWQVRHDWPTLEDLGNVARLGKNVVLGPLAFFGQQALLLHPVLLPLWIGGLVWLFLARRGRFRVFAWMYVVFYLMLFFMKAKNYYMAPIYPVLFAAGAVGFEAALARLRAPLFRDAVGVAAVVLVLAAGALTAPLVIPMLSPDGYVAYEKALGVTPPRTEVAHNGPLPQMFGDQFGWEQLVAEVVRAWYALTPEERARAGIFANNYGEAGAINLFGPRFGLPRAMSAHQTYFLWGPGDFHGDILIVLQDTRESLQRLCDSVEPAGIHYSPWGMAEENNPIYVCRGLKTPIQELWPQLKHWN
jgi:4-amino-4-deoxy-L-arabinose transferase-like glycosyltransferase